MPLSGIELQSFNAITAFVKDLSKVFGEKYRPLALYARLIEHTTFSCEVAIIKNIQSFSVYILDNALAIESLAEEKLNDKNIVYSDKLFIELKNILATADQDTKKAIWNHLLTIYGLICPDSQAKEILKKIKTNQASGTGTTDTRIIEGMIQKIAPHLSPDETNPMNAVMGLMQSGVFTDLVKGMQDGMDSGTVNVQSLFGTVSALFSQPDPTAKLATGSSDGKDNN